MKIWEKNWKKKWEDSEIVMLIILILGVAQDSFSCYNHEKIFYFYIIKHTFLRPPLCRVPVSSCEIYYHYLYNLLFTYMGTVFDLEELHFCKRIFQLYTPVFTFIIQSKYKDRICNPYVTPNLSRKYWT